jgi:hypothetical protein
MICEEHNYLNNSTDCDANDDVPAHAAQTASPSRMLEVMMNTSYVQHSMYKVTCVYLFSRLGAVS